MLLIKTTYPGLDPAQPIVNYVSTGAAHIKVTHAPSRVSREKLRALLDTIETSGSKAIVTVDFLPGSDSVASLVIVEYAENRCLVTNHDAFLLSLDGKKIDRLHRWKENEG